MEIGLSIIVGLLRMGWYIFFGIGLTLAVLVALKVRGYLRFSLLGLIALAFFVGPAAWLVSMRKEKEVELDTQRQLFQTRLKVFEEHCSRDARIDIKRTVEGVNGFFIMKGRVEAKNGLNVQHWPYDPYGHSELEARSLESFFEDLDNDGLGHALTKPIRAYKFLEMSNPARDTMEGHPAFVVVSPTGQRDSQSRVIYKREYSNTRRSQYGVDWDDISTQRDRDYWVAGGRMRIYDLATNEVMAERIGYLAALGGETANGSDGAWEMANKQACPPFPNPNRKTMGFVGAVLKSSKGKE